jgi:hypothetical protein
MKDINKAGPVLCTLRIQNQDGQFLSQGGFADPVGSQEDMGVIESAGSGGLSKTFGDFTKSDQRKLPIPL